MIRAHAWIVAPPGPIEQNTHGSSKSEAQARARQSKHLDRLGVRKLLILFLAKPTLKLETQFLEAWRSGSERARNWERKSRSLGATDPVSFPVQSSVLQVGRGEGLGGWALCRHTF